MDDEDVALETIIEQYSETDPAQIDFEEDPEPEAMPLVSTDEAIDMLERLCNCMNFNRRRTGRYGGASGIAKAQAST